MMSKRALHAGIVGLVLSLSACGMEPMNQVGDEESNDPSTIAAHVKDPRPGIIHLPIIGTIQGQSSWTGFNNMYGYELNTGWHVDSATIVYWDWKNSTPRTYGPFGGSGGAYCGHFECYGGSEWLVGVYGRSGSWIDQLGFVCADPNNPSVKYDLPACGGSGGSPFRSLCPDGYTIGQIGFLVSNVVYGLSVYCWDEINPS